MFKQDSQIVDYAYTEELIPRTKNYFLKWISNKLNFPLAYLEGDRAEKREDLKHYWNEAESAIVFLFSYYPEKKQLEKEYQKPTWNGLKLASYTIGFEGDDYHHLIRQKLESIGEELKEGSRDKGLDYRLALDIHPVLDRDLAYRSGLGWYGKNSMMIHKKEGSFFIIGSIILNQKLNLAKKEIEADHCGQCTRCIDSCPTEAIDISNRTIITNRCISTYTIELFRADSVPDEKMNLNSGYIFGCDICQDVCPWNKRLERVEAKSGEIEFNSKQKHIIDFYTQRPIAQLQDELESLSNKKFESIFKATSFSRSGKRGLLKNIVFYLKNKN